MAYQYDKPTLDLFTRIKRAADPKNIANPLKLIPLAYAEKRAPSSLFPPPHNNWRTPSARAGTPACPAR